MDFKLFQKLSPKDRALAKEVLAEYDILFKGIVSVLEDEYKSLDKELTIPPKNTAGWALQQAFLRGEQSAYQRLIKLLETRHE